jgi:GT2 family glycosyltransferase
MTPQNGPPKYRLVVSIINYKTAQMTIDCVASVLEDMKDLSVHVVVVDNKSGDDSTARIPAWIAEQGVEDDVTFVASEINGGFSAGHNIGMTTVSGEFYLVLNSDALLRKGFCATILAAAEASPKAGLIAPRLEWDDGEPQLSCFRLPSPASEIIRGAKTGPITSLLRHYDMPLNIDPDPANIGWASFACILLRGDMVQEIGLMDEGYFLYFEDTEYCMRAQRAGWTIAHVPQAHAVHFRGGSAPVKSLAKEHKRLPAYYYASRTRLFYQTYGWGGLLAANLGWSLGRLISLLRPLWGKSPVTPIAHEAQDTWINFTRPTGPSHKPNAS